jgi:hypothetical protein
LLVAPGDVGGLAAALLRLLEDGDLRCKLGAAAQRAYQAGPFQPAAVAAHYINIYRLALTLQATGGHPAPHGLGERNAA